MKNEKIFCNCSEGDDLKGDLTPFQKINVTD